MSTKLNNFKDSNTKKSSNIVTKLFDNNFLKEDFLKESVQEQIDMHLIVAHELRVILDKERSELKEFVARKTARITVVEDALARLSDSSMDLGKIRDDLNNGDSENK